MESESTYQRARNLLLDAKEYLPSGGAIAEEGGDPLGYAQVLAAAGLGTAILALCEELQAHREG